MTGLDEQRELNEWIAARLGWERVGDDWCRETEGRIEIALSLPAFTADPYYFAQVKREIERHGWSWASRFYPDKYSYYAFTIFGEGECMSGTCRRHPVIGYRTSRLSEEFAGCWAFKQAVEATDEDIK